MWLHELALMHQIKMRLDEWAQWSRAYAVLLGYPRENSINRAITYGTALRSDYRAPEIPSMPADVQAMDEALLGLRDVHPKAYEVIRSGYLHKRRDKWLARQHKTCKRTIQRWRKYGYEWLMGVVYADS